MTDAEKRKKVIWGLEMCSITPSNRVHCHKCPYNNGISIGCMVDLMKDALSLLKDSVPAELFCEVLRKYEVAELGMIGEYSWDTKAAEANLKKEIEKLKKKAGIEDA